MSKSWRDCARPIIARVLKENAGAEDQVIRKALCDAFPWGERAGYPYNIWCDEIQRQRCPIENHRRSKPKLAKLIAERDRTIAEFSYDEERS